MPKEEARERLRKTAKTAVSIASAAAAATTFTTKNAELLRLVAKAYAMARAHLDPDSEKG